jgi:uncharacterized protein (DUF2141 family)
MEDKMRKTIRLFLITLLFGGIANAQSTYVLIGWNDLGMHCDNKSFANIAVLPPYNNIYAQLIQKVPGQLPHIVTTGVTISYSIPGNTYSVGKTDFWTYAQKLFGLSAPLPPNIGLTGKGLTGTLDPAPSGGNYFFARGIPVTAYTDNNLTTENPFQLIHLVATQTGTSTVLATTDCVIPVSSEMHCVSSGCHASEQAILSGHEDGGFSSTPVLCASCHADNALGTTGGGEAPIFSQAMHEKHAELGLPNTMETCYKCHPGSQAQCLRGAMRDAPPPSSPMICQDCHGTLANVAQTISQGRRPWLDEPSCGTCHGSNFSPQPGKLFKDSQGHGGVFCEACHGSTHGLFPTRNANDNVQSVELQGMPGIIRQCTTCHTTVPSGAGPHGILASDVPPVTSITSPANGSNVAAGSNVTINASATDADGSISAVQFFQGNTLLGGVTSPPYTFTWNGVSAGTYALTVVALDNGRRGSQSIPINIVVGPGGGGNIPPTVSITSPVNGAVFSPGSNITIIANASDADGTVSSVAFYRGTTLLGTDNASPYSFTWNNVAAGSYVLTAVATDNGGAKTTSAPVNISVSSGGGGGNQPPVVTITSPSNGAVFRRGSDITITANASDPDGNIVRVAFYRNSNLLGIDNSSPYSFRWRNVSSGSYTLTAVATDNGGLTSTSPLVSITISRREGRLETDATAVEDNSILSNYPNPFNPSTTITYNLPDNEEVKVRVYDMMGREIKTLVDEFQQSGTHNILFNADGLSSGLYLCTIETKDFKVFKKMVYLK